MAFGITSGQSHTPRHTKRPFLVERVAASQGSCARCTVYRVLLIDATRDCCFKYPYPPERLSVTCPTFPHRPSAFRRYAQGTLPPPRRLYLQGRGISTFHIPLRREDGFGVRTNAPSNHAPACVVTTQVVKPTHPPHTDPLKFSSTRWPSHTRVHSETYTCGRLRRCVHVKAQAGGVWRNDTSVDWAFIGYCCCKSCCAHDTARASEHGHARMQRGELGDMCVDGVCRVSHSVRG
jgi:hypothetical protein